MKSIFSTFFAFSVSLATLGGKVMTPAEEFALTTSKSSQSVTGTFQLTPPLPLCGEFINSITYGPVTNATTMDTENCHETELGQIYRAYSHYKKKRIYQHGHTWVCYDQDPGICHTYHREVCPENSCAPPE